MPLVCSAFYVEKRKTAYIFDFFGKRTVSFTIWDNCVILNNKLGLQYFEGNYTMYRRDTKEWLKHLDFIVLDLIVLIASLALGYMLRHGESITKAGPVYNDFALFIVAWDLVVIFFTETFRHISNGDTTRNWMRLFISVKMRLATAASWSFNCRVRKNSCKSWIGKYTSSEMERPPTLTYPASFFKRVP